MKTFLIELIRDDKGHLSSTRVINLMIAICGCLISWKLVIMGGFNEAYFGMLLAYGGGVYGFGKAQEVKSAAKTEDNDPSLKAPKE